MKAIRYTIITLLCTLACSCVTSYDRYGNPIQTVDPVAATVGAVAIGAVAYSAGQNNSYNNSYNRSYNRRSCSTGGGGYYGNGRSHPDNRYNYNRTYNNYNYNNRCR